MVTDPAFRKSSLGKLFLEKIVPGTSKNWSYHTELLVFCLNFKVSLVCEYLNYYYNITNDCWAIPEKSKQGGIKYIPFFLKKTPGSFRFVTLSLEIVDKKSFLYPWKFCKIV